MVVNDELVDLIRSAGESILNDADGFRAALDDYVPEGALSLGQASLLVDAVRLGAIDRLRRQMVLGADPQSAIIEQATRLARDRGTREVDGAYWAVGVLAAGLGHIDLIGLRQLLAGSAPAYREADLRLTAAVDTNPGQGEVTDETRVGSKVDGQRLHQQDAHSYPHEESVADDSAENGRHATGRTLWKSWQIYAALVAAAIVLLLLWPDDEAVDPGSVQAAPSNIEGVPQAAFVLEEGADIESMPADGDRPILSWDEAVEHSGETRVVCGPLMSVTGDANNLFLNIGLDYPERNRFVIVLGGEDRVNRVQEFGKYLYREFGWPTCVAGQIEDDAGTASIAVKSEEIRTIEVS